MIRLKTWVENNYEWLYIISLISFFARSVFPPIKFVFVVSFILLVGLIIVKERINIHFGHLRSFIFPIVLFFFFLLAFFQNVSFYIAKEIINFVIVLIFCSILIVSNFQTNSFFGKLSRLYLNVFFVIGVLGIVKFVLYSFFGIYTPLLSYTSDFLSGTSLVDDYNFYSLFFLFGILIILSEFKKTMNNIKLLYHSFCIFLFTSVILFSSSRRALFVLVAIYACIILLAYKKNTIRKMLLLIISSILLVAGSLFFALNSDYVNPDKRIIITQILYRYINGVFIEETSFENFYGNIWVKKDIDNLHYDYNFKQGRLYWITTTSGVEFNIIKTKYGNAMRVHRVKGSGDFVLSYNGPKIIYKKDVNYKYKFKFRIMNGESVPFKVGWWIMEGGAYLYDIEKKITPIGDNWFECECSHTFKNTHKSNKFNFLNSVLENTVLDIADVKLFSSDSSQYKDHYFDGFIAKNGFLSLKNNSLRSKKWNYALHLWKTEFSLRNKLFGKGFFYLQKYGKKFYNDPKRNDYPHNPIISSFLYSGIIGGVFYILYLFVVLWYYWKYRKNHMVFFLMYLVTFFFMMFSGNSHFSVPVFTFLSLIPFLTKCFIESGKIKNMQDAI